MQNTVQAGRILPRSVLDWVALLERLGEDDREGLIGHLVALEPEDRRLRFGVAVDDAFIERYVGRIDFARDVVFGACTGPGDWLGVGHLVLEGEHAELGLSVLKGARGRGLGAAIFRFAVAHAARAGASRLYLHFLTSNKAILSIARSARMAIRSASGEADAHLVVPPYADFARMLMDEAPQPRSQHDYAPVRAR